MDGPPQYELGSVADALFLPGGGIAVLDRMAATIRVFDLEGGHRRSIGGIGDGPGEFDVPVSMLLPERDHLWVLDQARAMHRFRLSGADTFEFEDRVALPGFSSDACVSSTGTILLHTPAHMPGDSRGEVLYEIENNGDVRSQFAEPYRYDLRLAAKRMKEGRIACTDDGSVLLAFEAQNRLDAYNPTDGRLRWHATFEDVRILPVLEEQLDDGRPAIRMDLRSGPFHHLLVGIAAGRGTPAVIQYGRRSREDIVEGVDRYEVQTYVVDPASGTGVYAGSDIPEVLAISDDLVAFVHREPFPQVEVARLGGPATARQR